MEIHWFFKIFLQYSNENGRPESNDSDRHHLSRAVLTFPDFRIAKPPQSDIVSQKRMRMQLSWIFLDLFLSRYFSYFFNILMLDSKKRLHKSDHSSFGLMASTWTWILNWLCLVSALFWFWRQHVNE